MSYFKFLRIKLKGVSIQSILRLELESLLCGFFSLVPTTIGVILRGLISKLLFKRLDGFPWIQPRTTIVFAERITVGTNFGVNTGCYINGIGGITIGNYVLIGSNVTISSGMHPIRGMDPPVFARPSEPKPIIIHDDVWIGAGAVIMPGIILAKGSVIGANSVVTKNTEEFSISVGAPARKIADRRDN
jgi:maltose O-acetyltransferase